MESGDLWGKRSRRELKGAAKKNEIESRAAKKMRTLRLRGEECR